jgi:hypothetical protein
MAIRHALDLPHAGHGKDAFAAVFMRAISRTSGALLRLTGTPR